MVCLTQFVTFIQDYFTTFNIAITLQYKGELLTGSWDVAAYSFISNLPGSGPFISNVPGSVREAENCIVVTQVQKQTGAISELSRGFS